MSINVHIERVVLEGIHVEEAGSVQKGMERELARLVREGGLSQEVRRGGAVARLGADSIVLGRGRQGGRFGAQLAGVVYRGMGEHK